jgi:hypothetical protein
VGLGAPTCRLDGGGYLTMNDAIDGRGGGRNNENT